MNNNIHLYVKEINITILYFCKYKNRENIYIYIYIYIYWKKIDNIIKQIYLISQYKVSIAASNWAIVIWHLSRNIDFP